MTDTYFLKGAKRKKVSEDKKASGTSPSEQGVMMKETISSIGEVDMLNDCRKKKRQEASQASEEMRNVRLETFKQSQERSQDGQPKLKKRKEQVEHMFDAYIRAYVRC